MGPKVDLWGRGQGNSLRTDLLWSPCNLGAVCAMQESPMFHSTSLRSKGDQLESEPVLIASSVVPSKHCTIHLNLPPEWSRTVHVVLLEVKRYSEQSTTQFSLHFWPHGTRHRRLHGKY